MISAKDILARGRSNTLDRWSEGEDSAAARIGRRIVVPQGRQSFTAGPGDTFFAIGSCFARNVEERLELAGATVSSRNIKVRDLGDASARQGGTFNKYTPVSILQELKWAAGTETYPEAALLPAGGDLWYDPFLSGKAGHGSRGELMARRAEVAAYFAQAFAADVVILTLGLIETWIDRETGLTLNEAPNPRLLMRQGDRFAFESLSLEQCEAALAEIHALLAAHGKPGQKILVTVSPVPLGRTFTEDDIIVANMTAKSTLRVAAMRLADRVGGVDYFPSYEAALTSDPNLCWQGDRRHVSDVIVGQIIQTFLQRYGVSEAGPEDVSDTLAALRADPETAALLGATEEQDALIARLNKDVNRYKNMVIHLQKTVRRYEAAPTEDGPLARMRLDPAFQKWEADAPDADALIARLYREMQKYKSRVVALQRELARATWTDAAANE